MFIKYKGGFVNLERAQILSPYDLRNRKIFFDYHSGDINKKEFDENEVLLVINKRYCNNDEQVLDFAVHSTFENADAIFLMKRERAEELLNRIAWAFFRYNEKEYFEIDEE